MYVQVCTRSDLIFIIGTLGRYQSNQTLTYKRTENLEVIGCSDADFVDTERSRSVMSSHLQTGNFMKNLQIDTYGSIYYAS